jgi:uncharacterized membrane protein YbhN (UPF0104 family)
MARHHPIIRAFGISAMLAVFGAAVWLLAQEFRQVDLGEVNSRLHDFSILTLLLSVILASGSYLTLTSFDYIGLRYALKPLPYRQSALPSFIAYVFSNNIGLSIFGSLAFRFRLYSYYGLSIAQVTKVVLFCAATFWLGLLSLGGFLFLIAPPPSMTVLVVSPLVYRLIGSLALSIIFMYLRACWHQPETVTICKRQLKLPSGQQAAAQIGVGMIDWLFSAGSLYILLPDVGRPDWLPFISLFIVASVTSAISHVPAGLGVFDSIILAALARTLPASAEVSALVVFRTVYYLIPLLLATSLMTGIELHRQVISRSGRSAKRT